LVVPRLNASTKVPLALRFVLPPMITSTPDKAPSVVRIRGKLIRTMEQAKRKEGGNIRIQVNPL
jgi:hypothetical protein